MKVRVRGVHQALRNKAQDSTAERGTRAEVMKVEVQLEELSLVRDQ